MTQTVYTWVRKKLSEISWPVSLSFFMPSDSPGVFQTAFFFFSAWTGWGVTTNCDFFDTLRRLSSTYKEKKKFNEMNRWCNGLTTKWEMEGPRTFHFGSADTLSGCLTTPLASFHFISIPSLSCREWLSKGGSPAVRDMGVISAVTTQSQLLKLCLIGKERKSYPVFV